jgi:hypothetical protein
MASYGAFVVGFAPVWLQPLSNNPGKFLAVISLPWTASATASGKKGLTVAVWRATLEPVPAEERADVFLSLDGGLSWLAVASLTHEQESHLFAVSSTLLESVQQTAALAGHFDLQIGVSVENDRVVPRPATAAGIEQLGTDVSSVTKAPVGDLTALPQVLARDLYHFLQSFDTTLPDRCAVLLDRWLRRVEHRFDADPSWWLRVSHNR